MLRTYGRVTDPITGARTWVVVETDAAGQDGYVWATTVAQVLQLNLGESPFYANYGIPAHQSVLTQVQPDFYVARTQKQFAPYFASLIIAKTQSLPSPVYRMSAVTKYGTLIQANVAT